MAGGVGNDELALGGREVAVGHVDGDALLALGLQAVYEQRQVHFIASGTDLLGVTRDGFEVILVDHLGIVQQAPDQGALAVVHVPAGQEAQQLFAFVLGQVSKDILADQFGLMTHLELQAISYKRQACGVRLVRYSVNQPTKHSRKLTGFINPVVCQFRGQLFDFASNHELRP